MKIADAADLASKAVREIKEDAVRRHKGRVDLETTIMVYRGDEPVAIVNLPPHRDQMLRAVYLAAGGFSADVLAVTHDSFTVYGTPDEALNDPRTGKPWKMAGHDGPGSLQTYVQEYGFDGTVVEGLVTYVLNRAGDAKQIGQPYEVDGREVRWLEWEGNRPGMHWFGDVPNTLKKIMAEKVFEQLLPPVAVALAATDPVRARAIMDLGTVELIEQKAELPISIALFAKRGSRRDQILRERLARSRVQDPDRRN